MTPLNAYPLQWPAGWPRTVDVRRASRYQVPFGRARDDLRRRLRLLGAADIVISSNIPLRRDGLPYAGTAEPRDPGVAVYWIQRGLPRVMACDCWRTTRDNLRAIGLAVDALRAIERSGATQILERAFTGFAALPANAGDDGAQHWRDVLDLNGHPITADDVRHAYRRLLPLRHPDHGGSHEAIVELNRARAEALREVGPAYDEQEVR